MTVKLICINGESSVWYNVKSIVEEGGYYILDGDGRFSKRFWTMEVKA